MFGFIKKQRVQTSTDVLEKRLEAVMEINNAMSGVLDIEDVLSLITKRLLSVINVSFANILVWDETQKVLSVKNISAPKAAVVITEKALGRPFSEIKFYDDGKSDNHYIKALRTGEIIETKNLENLAYPLLNEGTAKIVQRLLNMKLALSIPLVARNKKLGVLGIIWKGDQITPEDKEILNTFVNQISSVIYNSQLFSQVQDQVISLTAQNHDLASLYNLASQVGRSLDPQVVAQIAVNSLPQDEIMAGALISFYDKKKNYLQPQAISQNRISEAISKVIGDFKKYSLDLTDPKSHTSLYYQAVMEEKPKISEDLVTVLTPPLPKKFVTAIQSIVNLSSVVVYPMFIRGKLVGTISYFLKNKKIVDFDENQQRLFETYTTQIAIALENAQLFTALEITQRNLEKAYADLKTIREKEKDMIDIMGHELRTPMSIVRNSLGMMELSLKRFGEIPKDKQARYVEQSMEAAKREIALIETLLSATKADANGFELTFDKVDLFENANESYKALLMQSKKKGIKLNIKAPEVELAVYADKTRVHEIVDNFISNAIKYTPSGSVKISFRKDENYAWMSVQDTGFGITQEDLAKLGRKFFRARQYTKKPLAEMKKYTVKDKSPEEIREFQENIIRPGGTGLGLYVAFSLIKVMNGKLHIKSKIGVGSTFEFAMPLYKGQKSKQEQREIDMENNREFLRIENGELFMD